MDFILIAVIVLGSIGLIAAIVLFVCSKKFAVFEDPRIAQVKTVGYSLLSTEVTTIDDMFLFSGGILVKMSSLPAANTNTERFFAASLQTLAHSAATLWN